ncbi:MAG: FRG domain-containing protein [Liquorilactobacillus hordei]|nr:FRG domain-containing protein [Lentilactobacillus hilgardii]
MHQNPNNFIYRGCACESYDLVPPLARKQKPNVSFDTYAKYADILKKAAKRGYTEVGMSGHVNDLSQHYGLSTSYLDWSYLVYVAMYFAFTSYLKKFVDENILDQQIDPSKMCILRNKFNNHNYCIYKLNKTLYDEIACKYPNLPLKVYDTDFKNERMKSQQGLLSCVDGNKVTPETKIQDSQIEILVKYFNQTDSRDVLKTKKDENEKIINCFWKNKLLFEKIPFKLSQIERNYLQKCLKENGAISTKLFPDFEGVKKNIVFSEDYNILRDWHIAYQEADFHQTWTTDSGLNKDQIDQLDEGEFFAFQ